MAIMPWGLVSVHLSESDWTGIKSRTDLPNEARREIEGALALFQYFQRGSAESPRAGVTRKKLLKIVRNAESLLEEIMGTNVDLRESLSRLEYSQFSGNLPIDVLLSLFGRIAPDVLQALFETPRKGSAGPMPKHDALQLLCERCWAVERLRNWASNAANSLPSESTGAHKRAENNRWLVSQLDAILFKHTQTHITRSYKKPELQDYVTVCFNAADPSIGSGSIQEVMKDVIRLKPSPGEIANNNES